MKFQIDRSKWRFGGDDWEGLSFKKYDSEGVTQLLNKQGKMCCLGFFSLACGYSESDIENSGEPWEAVVDCDKNLYPEGFVLTEENEHDESIIYDSKLTDDLVALNDDPNLSETEREKKLKAKFAEAGIEVEFVGEYPS